MTIYLGENIRHLRLEKKLSQETLADFLGVSFQSVSRWERGESYPDITMLPSIASFFNVTVDSLLGVSRANNEKKVQEYLDIYDKMRLKELELTFEKFKVAVRELPGDFRIMIRYMQLLQEAAIFSNSSKIISSGEYKKLSKELSDIYESIQKHCTDDSIRIWSKKVMISHLMWKYDCICDECGKYHSNKDFLNQAVEIASTLPSMHDSRELNQISDKDNHNDICKSALEELTFELHASIYSYCLQYPTKERIKQFEATQAILDLIYPDGDFGKNSFNRLYSYGHLGHLYHEAGNDKKSLENLNMCADYAIKLDSQPDETERIKRFYNYGTAYRELSTREFIKTVMTEHYPLSDKFKSSEEFKSIIKKLE